MSAYFITTFIIGAIVLYSVVFLLNYNGLNLKSYGIYLSFYTFLFISAFILPRQVPSFE